MAIFSFRHISAVISACRRLCAFRFRCKYLLARRDERATILSLLCAAADTSIRSTPSTPNAAHADDFTFIYARSWYGRCLIGRAKEAHTTTAAIDARCSA